MTTFVSSFCRHFQGVATVPGDKSISHRALIISALAHGTSTINGLLESEDVNKTAQSLKMIGIDVEKNNDVWNVEGIGGRALKSPTGPLDFGNSGTSARLLAGVLSARPVTAVLDGDESLRTRPMGRIIAPLSEIGARFEPQSKTTLPLTVHGTGQPKAITYRLPVPSAQVKSAILLAGLNIDGVTEIIERYPSRDHTERMLAAFGAEVTSSTKAGEHHIRLAGHPTLRAREIDVPGDISSAAFPLAAALLVKGGALQLSNVGTNPLRTGFLDVIQQMGAALTLKYQKDASGEPVADIEVHHRLLHAVKTDAAIAPRMIDEFPILFVLAAFADGVSEFRGLKELRHKESNRLKLMAEGLKACGVAVDEFEDGLAIRGGPVKGGTVINAGHDHRIAMSFLVLGMASEKPVTVTGAETISTSFPGFAKLMNGLGAHIEEQP